MLDKSMLPQHHGIPPVMGADAADQAGIAQIRRELTALYDILGIEWCQSCETFHAKSGPSSQQMPMGGGDRADSPATAVGYPPVI